MALKLRWTREAVQQLDAIIDYLETNWSEKEIRKFFQKLEEGIKTISEQPELHKLSARKKGAREYQLARQTTIFYDFDEAHVTVLLVWSNRKDSEKLK